MNQQLQLLQFFPQTHFSKQEKADLITMPRYAAMQAQETLILLFKNLQAHQQLSLYHEIDQLQRFPLEPERDGKYWLNFLHTHPYIHQAQPFMMQGDKFLFDKATCLLTVMHLAANNNREFALLTLGEIG